MTASPSTVLITSNLVYTLSLTNYGPAGATNIVVSDTLPAGVAYIGSTPSQGMVVTNGAGVLTWTLSQLGNGASASLTLAIQPNAVGSITNLAAVSALTADANPDDNTVSLVTTVAPLTADLALSMVGVPNPLPVGSNLTYTITVTNAGPATAPNVVVLDTLPAGVSFVSGGSLNAGVVTTSLGNLGSGTQTSFAIVVRPLIGGTIINSASCSSDVTDPLKGNNSASVKTIVLGPPVPLLGAVRGPGMTVVISWPASAGNYGLEFSTNLAPPVVWTPLTSPAFITVNGTNSVTVPIGNGSRFYRPLLQGP
jgi:uncharacterized repeat protein (TIGR01451 family)